LRADPRGCGPIRAVAGRSARLRADRRGCGPIRAHTRFLLTGEPDACGDPGADVVIPI
jgi:hypothetical protein